MTHDMPITQDTAVLLEFKTSFDKATVETLVAFANTRGGTVLTSPSIIPVLQAHQFNGKTIVAIDIAEFPVKPVSTKGRCYKRVASSNQSLNAVVHRDYTDGSDIQVKIFDKQITIFSPGTFYGKLTVADVQSDNYRSSMRNKLIVEGFCLTRAIETYGSGAIRIRKALLDYRPERELCAR